MSFWDIISYNKGAGYSDGNNYWKKYRVPHYIYIYLMLTLMGVGIGVVSLFLCSPYLGQNGYSMFVSYFTHPLIAVLNILPCVLLVYLAYFISGRAWVAFTFPSALILILSAINYYKIQLRNEAFIAKDIAFFGEAAGVINNYTLSVTPRILATLFCVIFGVLFAVFLMKGVMKNKWVRIIGVILVIALCAALYVTVYTNDKVYSKADNSEGINIWSDLQVYISKGFVYSFINSIPDAFPTLPEGYNEKDTETMLSAYSDGTIDESKKVDVISVMLEAYTDLTVFENLTIRDDVYAPMHELRDECIHGNIISNVFGGGTINTERGFLTGYTESEDYSSATNSYLYFLREQGYYTEGFHTGDDWFYNRENVEKYLGMENYYFLQDYNTTDRSDEFFFATLTDLYENRDKNVPYFNYSITYQNHGAYPDQWTYEESFLEKGDLSDSSYNILNNYLFGIADTNRRIYDFIDSFRDSEEPIVIVFFGDHMPWLGNANSVYTELGINLDLGTEEGFYNHYSVPYIIWANDAAKETLGNDFTGEGEDISSCFLMDTLFTQCGWGKPVFMQLNHQLYELTNVVNITTGHYNIDGALTVSPQGEAAELIRKAKHAEYYMKHNFMYD